MTWFDVYLITRLSYVQGCFIATAVIFGVAAIGIAIFATAEEEWDKTKKIWWRIVGGMFLSIFLACLTPNTKEAVAIYLVPKVANNEQVQQIPENILKYVNNYLKEITEEKEGR